MRSSAALSARRGVLYIAIAATAWGTGGAVAALLYDLGDLGPASVSFWRFVSGVGLLLVVRALQRWRTSDIRSQSLPRTFLRNRRHVLVTGVGLAVYQTAYFAAVQHAGLTVATVVTLGSGPVLVAVGGRVFLEERINLAGVFAVASGVLGLVILTEGSDRSTGQSPLLGLGYAILSALGYAGVTLLGRATGRRQEGNTSDLMLLGFGIGVVCLLPVALSEGILPSTEQLPQTVAAIGYLGLIPTALAYTLFFTGLGAIRATTASVVALVEPLTAAVIGVAALGERLNPVIIIGTALLMCSVFSLAFAENAKDQGGTVPEAGSRLGPD